MPQNRENLFRRLRIAVVPVALFAAMLYSIEPTHDFFIESALERHYQDFQVFRKVSHTLNSQKLSESTLKDALTSLEQLKKRDFVLSADCDVLIGEAQYRLGKPAAAEKLLLGVIQSDGETAVRTDALMRLAYNYDKQGHPAKSLALLEKHPDLYQLYRRSEACFYLYSLYSRAGRPLDAARVLLKVDALDTEDKRNGYRQALKDSFSRYSAQEMEAALQIMTRMNSYITFAELSLRYIKAWNPGLEKVENLASVLVNRGGEDALRIFLLGIRENTNYSQTRQEIEDYLMGMYNPIRSKNGVVRGSYYNRQLRSQNRRANYNAPAAYAAMTNYLSGDVDSDYVKKNLQLAVRSLIAHKKYDLITNVLGLSYGRLGLSSPDTGISEDISFWYGYSLFRLGSYSEAMVHFETAVIMMPDSYFGVMSRDYIESCIASGRVSNGSRQLQSGSYTAMIKDRYDRAPDINRRLSAARLLYGITSGPERDGWSQKVVELSRKLYSTDIFDFDNLVLFRLRTSRDYLKFIIYSRYGLETKARMILSSIGVHDPYIQNILIVRELVKVRDFSKSRDVFLALEQNDFIRRNLSFLPFDLQRVLYPMPYETEIELAMSRIEKPAMDKYMVYAIIRGESFYIPTARSRAGARGLMQLMPGTARLIARGLLGQREVNLYNPYNNVILGTSYLSSGINSLGMLCGVASYNGGENVINRTKRRFKPANDVELVEILPYTETRDYVRKIMSYYRIYRSIYSSPERSTASAPLYKNRV